MYKELGKLERFAARFEAGTLYCSLQTVQQTWHVSSACLARVASVKNKGSKDFWGFFCSSFY